MKLFCLGLGVYLVQSAMVEVVVVVKRQQCHMIWGGGMFKEGWSSWKRATVR